MKVIEIDSIEELFGIIVKENKNEDCWFRGQTDSDYSLCPQIFRDGILTDDFYHRPIKPRPMKGESPDEIKGYKFMFCNPNSLIHEFKEALIEEGIEELKEDNDLSIMCLGQHYGLSTELLDWTTDALVALHFSLTEKENDSALFILKPKLFNRNGEIPKYTNLKDHFNDVTDTIAFYGPRDNSRICRQSGNFTLHKDYSYYKLDLYGDTSKYLTKLIIKHKLHKQLNTFLKGVGINKDSIYVEDDYKDIITKKAKKIEQEQKEKIINERMKVWENTTSDNKGIERRWTGGARL